MSFKRTAVSKNRALIITGDDFGFSSSVNRAILSAHENGVLTSASLIVTGEAFEEAVTLARAHPMLAVGLHLVVICGKALLSHDEIPHLVDELGRFSSSPLRAGLRYQWSRPARRELHLEIRAQLEKFRQTGLRLSHVDGHLHMHLHPVALDTLVDLSKEFGIRAIRLPFEELGMALKLDQSGSLTKLAHFWIFSWLRTRGERRLKSAGIEFAERVYGLLQTGRVTEEYLLRLIPQINADRVEIYSHPTTQAESDSPKGASRAQLDALLSQRVREALASSGFQLATYT